MNTKKQTTKEEPTKETTKETTKEEPKEEVDIKKMETMSGEKDIKQAPRYPLSSLKMNGKIGKFYRTNLTKDDKLVLDDDGIAVLEEVKNPSGIILKLRKIFTAKEKDYQLFSSEIGNEKKELISVFEKRKTEKGFSINFIFQGTAKATKIRFPEVAMTQIIYFLLESGEIVRLKVRGMSLGYLFAYWKKFEPSEHLFEFVTELGASPEKNDLGSFFVNTFKKGKRVESLAVVAKAMKEVCNKLAEIENFYKDKIYEVAETEETTVENTYVPVKDGKLEDDTADDKSKIPWLKEKKEPSPEEINALFGADK